MRGRSGAGRVLDVVTSARFGFTLMAAAAMYAALGTVPLGPVFEALGGTTHTLGRTLRHLPAVDLTKAEYYRTSMFAVLLVLIAVSTFGATVWRVRWRWSRGPAHLAHIAVAVGAVGAWMQASGAFNETAVVTAGGGALMLHSSEATEVVVSWEGVSGGDVVRLGLEEFSRYTPEVRSGVGGVLEVGGERVRVEVVERVPRGVLERELVPADGGGAGPGVMLSEVVGGEVVARHALLGVGARAVVSDDVAVVVVDGEDRLMRAALGIDDEGAVVVEGIGGEVRAIAGLSERWSGDGVVVEWIDAAVGAGAAGSRAVVRAGRSGEERLVALRPWDVVDVDGVGRVVFVPGADAGRWVVFDGGERLVVRDEGGVDEFVVAVGRVVDAGDGVDVRVDGVFASARAVERVMPVAGAVPVPDTLTDEREGSWVRVRLTRLLADGVGGDATEVWVPFAALGERSVGVMVPGMSDAGEVVVTHAPVRRLVGDGARLVGFSVETFGGELPRDFSAVVEVGNGGTSGRVSFGLNDPARLWLSGLGAATLTLTGWDAEGWAASRDSGVSDDVLGGARYVVLRLTNRGGVWVLGAAGVMLAVAGGWAGALGVRRRFRVERAAERGGEVAPVGRRGWGTMGLAGVGLALGCVVVGVAVGGGVFRVVDGSGGVSMDEVGVVAGDRAVPMGVAAERFAAALTGGGEQVDEMEAVELFVRAAVVPGSLSDAAVIGVEDPRLRRELGLEPGGLMTLAGAREIVERAVERGGGDVALVAGLGEVRSRVRLVDEAGEAFVVVPGGRDGLAGWGTLRAARGEIGALRDRLVVAVELGDAALADEAMEELAVGLGRAQELSIGVAGRGRLRAELALERSSVLAVAVVGLVGAAGLLGMWLAVRKGWLLRVGGVLSWFGVGVVSGWFGVRWFVAERVPVQNQWESLLGLGLMAAVLGGVASVRAARSVSLAGGRRWGGVGAAACVMGAVGGEPGWVPGMRVEREAGVLASSPLLVWHVVTTLGGYAALSAAAIAGVGVLVGRGGDGARALDRGVATLSRWAFWLLTVGIALGAVWADRAWGRWWAFDAKETWALVTWMCVLAVVHVPAASAEDARGVWGERRRARVRAWLVVVSFVVMVWTYFGVNLLLPTLHGYA